MGITSRCRRLKTRYQQKTLTKKKESIDIKMMKELLIFIGIFAIALSVPIQDEDTKAVEKKIYEELARDLADKYDMDDEELDQLMADPSADPILGLIHHAIRGVLGAAHGLINFVGHIAGK